MKSRLNMLVQVLAFYSWVFILATSYYQIKGYPAETTFLPFVEGVVFMIVASTYMILAIVRGRVKNKVVLFTSFLFFTMIVLATIFRSELILLVGGFAFGLPSFPVAMLTFGNFTSLETWLLVALAIAIIIWSYIRTTNQSQVTNSVQ